MWGTIPILSTLALLGSKNYYEPETFNGLMGFPCPTPEQIQDPDLPGTFSLDKFIGNTPYYELALHDYTQPMTSGCTRSNKTLTSAKVIEDNFTMVVPWLPKLDFHGPIYISNLSFNTTNKPGVFNGFWPLIPGTVFPDTVVAVGKDVQSKNKTQYSWAIEFQCVGAQYAFFVGINFYARANVGPLADLYYQEMHDKAVSLGIDRYWSDSALGLRRLNHTGCFYE